MKARGETRKIRGGEDGEGEKNRKKQQLNKTV